jgi:hypothetical protein
MAPKERIAKERGMAGERTRVVVPRIERVPPLRCSQFAAPIWTAGRHGGTRAADSGIAGTSCRLDDGDGRLRLVRDRSQEMTPRRTA